MSAVGSLETTGKRTPDKALRKPRRTMLVERPRWWVYAILGAIVAGSLFPLYWSYVIASTTSGNANARIPVLVPGGNFLSNAARVIDTIPFWGALANSLFISVVVTASTLFFCTLAGYAFAKLPFKGSKWLSAFVVLTLAVPPQLGAVGLYRLMADWGWTGTIGAVIFPVLVSAFGVFFMRQYLEGVIPTELIEAARMDGAGQFRTFMTVAVPAARPAAAVLGLFTFITTWTDFFWPFLVLRDPDVQTLQTALAQLWASSGNNPDMSLILTGSLMSIIPLLILFVIAGKQLVAGIMSGAVKS
ncbi:carbohydrate ABC transporter permease [Serinibacter salmoneus]|uniref:Cellobiose ABC transporter membrane protein n=1 Tax=Serinibacter salmoneus TaxID=556530 RepID=A0A2A9CZZ5_9MICO|nr:carbohydrate ABC transporter permease [Serinibacter salmoneus]PFG19963.1 cellobiose ABC transporter membrane protein [Serinibacter salmoneus]